MWQANRFVSLFIHILEGFSWRTSTCGEVEAELGSPAVQLVEHPAPGLHRKMFMPGPGLEHPELWDERVHLGVELNYHLVGVVVVGAATLWPAVWREGPQSRLTPAARKASAAIVWQEVSLSSKAIWWTRDSGALTMLTTWCSRLQVRKFAIPAMSSVSQKPRKSWKKVTSLSPSRERTATCPRRSGDAPVCLKPGAEASIAL